MEHQLELGGSVGLRYFLHGRPSTSSICPQRRTRAVRAGLVFPRTYAWRRTWTHRITEDFEHHLGAGRASIGESCESQCTATSRCENIDTTQPNDKRDRPSGVVGIGFPAYAPTIKRQANRAVHLMLDLSLSAQAILQDEPGCCWFTIFSRIDRRICGGC